MAPLSKSASKSVSKAPDAIALLKADHKAVDLLFAEYAATRSSKKKKTLVSKICSALSVHAQVEEEIFYPAVKAALKDKQLVPEAIVEQATMKALIAQIEGIEPDGEMYDAKVMVLCEYVKHHVKEEHTEMFPKAKTTGLDMKALGAQLQARKVDLMAQQPANH
jgi:hemerythrin superfamily protein